jgi:hypothetical protein
MTVVRITISGTADRITQKIIAFARDLDANHGRDVKWETINDEVLVIPSPVVEQGPYKSQPIAIEVAERHGWTVTWQENGEHTAVMPNGGTAYLEVSWPQFHKHARWHWVLEDKPENCGPACSEQHTYEERCVLAHER